MSSYVPLARSLAPTLRAHASENDRLARFPLEAIEALGAVGLMGLLVPKRYGGMGGSLGDLAAVAACLAEDCVATAFVWAMHCQQVDLLVRYCTEDQAAIHLPPIAAGTEYIASVTTGADPASTLLRVHDAALRQDAHIVFQREAPIVTGGAHATSYLLTLRSSPEANPDDVTLIYARRDQVSVEQTSTWDPMGMRATASVGLRISGDVPTAQVIGASSAFRQIAMDSLITVGHIAWSAAWLGAARGAMREYQGRLRQASQGGSRPSEVALHSLGMLRVELETAWVYLRDTILRLDRARAATQGSMDSASAQIAMNALKIHASRVAYRIADRLVELAGVRSGYQRHTGTLERTLRDLRSAAINNSDDRLLVLTGNLCLLDPEVTLAALDLEPELLSQQTSLDHQA